MDLIEAVAIPGFREPVNCFSHLLAAPLFAIFGIAMVARCRHAWQYRLSLGILVFCTVFLLSMSGVYHMLPPGTGRIVMRRLDIAGVFAVIAGTATPIQMILFRGRDRWAPLAMIWIVAIFGITLRSIYEEHLPPLVGNTLFVLMGWGGAIGAVHLWRHHGSRFIAPLLAGGMAYTIGVVLLSMRWPILVPGVIGAHELWHVAVLIGLGLHWKFIYQIATAEPDVLPTISLRPVVA